MITGICEVGSAVWPASDKFLVFDSDTVLTGRDLDAWSESRAPFFADGEKPQEADTKGSTTTACVVLLSHTLGSYPSLERLSFTSGPGVRLVVHTSSGRLPSCS